MWRQCGGSGCRGSAVCGTQCGGGAQVVVLLCRSCVQAGGMKDMNWDLALWLPLIDSNKVFLPWLVKVPGCPLSLPPSFPHGSAKSQVVFTPSPVVPQVVFPPSRSSRLSSPHCRPRWSSLPHGRPGLPSGWTLSALRLNPCCPQALILAAHSAQWCDARDGQRSVHPTKSTSNLCPWSNSAWCSVRAPWQL